MVQRCNSHYSTYDRGAPTTSCTEAEGKQVLLVIYQFLATDLHLEICYCHKSVNA